MPTGDAEWWACALAVQCEYGRGAFLHAAMQIYALDTYGKRKVVVVWRDMLKRLEARNRKEEPAMSLAPDTTKTIRKPACQSCRYWDRADDPVDGTMLGLCRRYPPTYDGWAMTAIEDWCGEWQQC